MGTLLFISGQEIFVIMIVVLLLFGADKLPDMAKSIGKGMRDFRKATDEIRREIETSTRDIRNEMSDIQNSVQQEVSDISDNIEKNINDTTESFNADIQEVTNEFQKGVDDINKTAETAAGEYSYSSYDYDHQPDDFKQPEKEAKENDAPAEKEPQKHPDDLS